jgi:Na+/proline symporter
MNIYFIGMCLSMVIYVIIGILVSKKIQNVEDYYVAGRRAPVALIAGSLVASYTSTGMFLGDSSIYYQGGFNGLFLCGAMTSAGYFFGSVFFGRFLRRSQALTIPEFFGKRFCSKHVKNLAAFTAIVTMLVYLISVMQGIGTLMSGVTGINYNVCIILALIVFTFITVLSGSSGVLITDTIMASVFTIALVVGVIFVSFRTGGWFHSVAAISASPELHDLLSWKGIPGSVASTTGQTLLWGFINGIVWMAVATAGPWQTSRYLMAKDESTIVASTVPAALGIFILEFLVAMTGCFVKLYNPNLEDPAQTMIYASMNLMPVIVGVVMLTGVLAAGISSATTFLSLIGASFANDVFKSQGENAIRTGRIAMVITSILVLVFCIINPPALFWIMLFGGSIVAASWMPVALASVISRKVTKAGAYAGMLVGFILCFSIRLYTATTGTVLPVWMDHALVGMVANTLVMILVSAFTRVTEEEKEEREQLLTIPESEKEPAEVKKMLLASKAGVLVGFIMFGILMVLWVLPFHFCA